MENMPSLISNNFCT